MDVGTSRSARNRQDGRFQKPSRRESILQAAEVLFLQKGLENVRMIEIAQAAGITKVTLYRYFASRDPIAFEIATRMLRRITTAASLPPQPGPSLMMVRSLALAMVQQFYPLRDAFRYIGMFDHLYGDQYPTQELATAYKASIFALELGGVSYRVWLTQCPQAGQVIMAMNASMSFLEKMAGRGELMTQEQEVPLDDQLASFAEMIADYFDRLIAASA
jgi:AcrR family transcriptional regulator